MVSRVTCPLCSMLVWESQIQRSPHRIEVRDQRRKPHSKKGWDYIPIVDKRLVDLVKAKVKVLYDQFFVGTGVFGFGNRPDHLFVGRGKPKTRNRGVVEL